MDRMIRLSEEQAEIYIPLNEDFTGATIEDCNYFYHQETQIVVKTNQHPEV